MTSFRRSRRARRRTCPLAAVVVGLLAFLGCAPAIAQPAPETEPDHEVIVVGVNDDAFPLSYFDSDGRLKGFGVDVTQALATEMGTRVELRAFPPPLISDALSRGDIDVIQLWARTEAREQWFDFTVPVVQFELVAVVRTDETRIRQLADLAGKRVAVEQPNNAGDRYLRREHPTLTPVYSGSSEESLRLLSRGGCDAVIMARLSAHSRIERLGLRNVKVLEDRVRDADFDVRYCYAVAKGDSLLGRLNRAIFAIRDSGEFDHIYDRWFAHLEQRRISASAVLVLVACGLAIGCAATLWGFFRHRALSRKILQQSAELTEQRSLLDALYQHHPLATIVLEVKPDDDVRLASLNPEAKRLLHLQADITGLFLDACDISPARRKHLEDAVARWRHDPRVPSWEARIDEVGTLVDTAIVPLGPGDRTSSHLCILMADVTEERHLDQEIARARRLRALGELVGGIAHEFNNLLTPIVSTTNILQREKASHAQTVSDLGLIEEAARRATELTQRLLAFGKRHDESIQSVALKEVVTGALALVRPSIDSRVSWQVDLVPSLPPIPANPTNLHQILINLVLNARDALLERLSREGAGGWSPQICVRVGETPAHESAPALSSPDDKQPTPEAWQFIEVEDNGPGIPREYQDRIFEPFFTTKDVGKGTGLGLATVWNLTTDAGGHVKVDSAPGRGTRIRVLIPRGPVETPPQASTPPPVGPLAPTTARRVILVDDEPLVARSTIALLKRAGHSVLPFDDGATAWAHIQSHPDDHDVLLIDLNMPRMNGVELVRRVRTSPFGGHIIVMSGRITADDRRALEQLRIDRLLPKPFTLVELADAIANLANKPAP